MDDAPDAPGDLAVTVLGCSGSYAGPGEACSGYLVRSPGATIVVDLGSGTLANLQRHVAVADVDALVLTHEHPDHWLDLPVLRNAMRYLLDLADLPVYGTAGTMVLARTLIRELTPTLVWQTIDGDSVVEVGDLSLRFSTTDHPVETLAVRIDRDERSLLYSADTGPAWDAQPIGEAVGTFLCEASFAPSDEDRHQHLSARQAAGFARSIRAGRLVLTHVPPGVDAAEQRRLAADVYDGPIDLATTGATFAA